MKVYFEVGSAIPPTDATDQLKPLVSQVSSSPELKLEISGFHDKSGDAAANMDLAKKRAQAVRSLLVAAGVDEGRIVMSAPEQTTGGADDQEARRVEVGIAS